MKFLLLIFSLHLCFFINTIAQNNLSKDFPVLNQTYQADSKRADYVIVIDQSGSMRNYWSNVKSGISALIRSLPDEDYVSILGFSSECQALVVPRKLNQSSKIELISQIERLPNPTGQKTDLFEAVDKTLDEINRPNSNELKFLFFITDFINDPPSNTRWNHTNIHSLKEKYERIVGQTERLLKLYALQLPLEINAGRDYDRFANIFHTISSPIFLNQSTLLEWFDRLKAEIEREKLRMIVENDIKDAIKISYLENSFSLIEKDSYFNLNILNKSLLPLHIDSVVISSKEYGKIQSSGLMDEAIPNEGLTLKIPLNREMLLNEGTFCQKYPVTVENFEIFTSTKEVTEFGKLNLNPAKIYTIENPLTLTFLVGFNCWQILITIILLLLLLYYLFYPCLKSVWLFDRKGIKVSIDINDKIVELEKSFFPSSKNPLRISHTIIEVNSEQPDIRDIFKFAIVFVPQKPKCIIRKPKAGTYVKLELGEKTNESYELTEAASGNGNRIILGNQLTDVPINFSNGIRIESSRPYLGDRCTLKIVIKKS